jgi:excisionase family DNA binding protein
MVDGEVTLQEAADLLGVHYMTAYRYVRLGLLPAAKVGSVWRVQRSALVTFQQEAATPPPMSDNGRPSRKRAPWDERLEARLLAGDSRGAWGVIEAALAAGTDLDAVYLEVIAPAMTSIGDRWAKGELDISYEHRASGITMRIIGRLGPRFARRGRTRGSVVLGTPPGERHSLPIAMLADIVRASGFEVSDLGADVPAESFVFAAGEAQRLVAVGISVTSVDSLAATTDVIGALRSTMPTVPILVGGHAVQDEAHARALGADAWASDGRSAVTVLDRLVSGTVDTLTDTLTAGDALG